MRSLLVALALTGCAAKPVGDIGIACTADTDCPQQTWCDLRYDHVCRSLEQSAPPHVAFDGFLIGEDQLAPTISVPAKTVSIRSFRLRNDGGSQTDVTVEVSGPPCLDAYSLVRGDGELVDEGDSFDADFTVDPIAGCPSPATLTITATASDRVFTFTAMISIAP